MRACKSCREKYQPTRPMQVACSIPCALKLAEKQKEKKKRTEKKEHRKKLHDSKPLSHWLKLTESVVNRYVRLRDHGQPCISCGTTKTVLWQAGHFFSVGSHPELRFDPVNINLQCHKCNVMLSGNQAMYAIGLEAKWGKEEKERLEGPHAPKKYTREQLEAVRKHYSAKARELEKQR